MSATNNTPFLSLPNFTPNDEPSWLGDWNYMVNKVDEECKRLDVSVTAAINASASAEAKADEAEAKAQQALDEIAELPSAGGITEEQADARYLKLTGGIVTNSQGLINMEGGILGVMELDSTDKQSRRIFSLTDETIRHPIYGELQMKYFSGQSSDPSVSLLRKPQGSSTYQATVLRGIKESTDPTSAVPRGYVDENTLSVRQVRAYIQESGWQNKTVPFIANMPMCGMAIKAQTTINNSKITVTDSKNQIFPWIVLEGNPLMINGWSTTSSYRIYPIGQSCFMTLNDTQSINWRITVAIYFPDKNYTIIGNRDSGGNVSGYEYIGMTGICDGVSNFTLEYATINTSLLPDISFN